MTFEEKVIPLVGSAFRSTAREAFEA